MLAALDFSLSVNSSFLTRGTGSKLSMLDLAVTSFHVAELDPAGARKEKCCHYLLFQIYQRSSTTGSQKREVLPHKLTYICESKCDVRRLRSFECMCVAWTRVRIESGEIPCGIDTMLGH
jgi:hypothetical protein